MKDSRKEKLSEHLLYVDEDILARAYEIDDAEKLKKYSKNKKLKKRQPFYKGNAFKGVAVAAACLVLTVGVMLSLPAFMKANSGNNDGEGSPDVNKAPSASYPDRDDASEPTGYITVESLDMLNYYSAMHAISESGTRISDGVFAFLRRDTGASLSLFGTAKLAYGWADDEPDTVETAYDVGIPDTAIETPVLGDRPIEPKPPQDLIIYYELNPTEEFYVYSAIYFKIKLTDEEGFLASKIGTGEAEVVITQNNIEDMITFRNGDRFFSCCLNGGGGGEFAFSTHKYIEDFCIVKNLEQVNYQFVINFNEAGEAVSVRCESFDRDAIHPDRDISVVGDTVKMEVGISLTIAELEEYLNSGRLPEVTGKPVGSEELSGTKEPEDGTSAPVIIPESFLYIGGTYAFELMPDGYFAYFDLNDAPSFDTSPTYRKGEYSWEEDSIRLSFMYEGEIVETAVCPKTGENSFVYGGIEYAKEPWGGVN